MKSFVVAICLLAGACLAGAAQAGESTLKSYAQWQSLCSDPEARPVPGAPCPEAESTGGPAKGRHGRGGRPRPYSNVAPGGPEMLVTLSGVALNRQAAGLVRQVREDDEARTDLLLHNGLNCTLMSANPTLGSSPLTDTRALESFYYVFKDAQPPRGAFNTRRIVFRKQPALLFEQDGLTGIYIRGASSAVWSACDGPLDAEGRRMAKQLFDAIVMSTREYF